MSPTARAYVSQFGRGFLIAFAAVLIIGLVIGVFVVGSQSDGDPTSSNPVTTQIASNDETSDGQVDQESPAQTEEPAPVVITEQPNVTTNEDGSATVTWRTQDPAQAEITVLEGGATVFQTTIGEATASGNVQIPADNLEAGGSYSVEVALFNEAGDETGSDSFAFELPESDVEIPPEPEAEEPDEVVVVDDDVPEQTPEPVVAGADDSGTAQTPAATGENGETIPNTGPKESLLYPLLTHIILVALWYLWRTRQDLRNTQIAQG